MTSVTAQIEDNIMDWLKEKANKEKRSVASIVKMALEDYKYKEEVSKINK